MKIRTLIAALETLPQDDIVAIGDQDHDSTWFEVTEIFTGNGDGAVHLVTDFHNTWEN